MRANIQDEEDESFLFFLLLTCFLRTKVSQQTYDCVFFFFFLFNVF